MQTNSCLWGLSKEKKPQEDCNVRVFRLRLILFPRQNSLKIQLHTQFSEQGHYVNYTGRSLKNTGKLFRTVNTVFKCFKRGFKTRNKNKLLSVIELRQDTMSCQQTIMNLIVASYRIKTVS